jgi:adenosylhomocysteine nucleosidase
MDYFTSAINSAHIDVLLTGIGGRKPWLEVAGAIYESEIQLCVSSGLAGGLRPEHQIGEVLVAEKVLAPTRNTSAASELAMVDAAVSAGAKKVACFYTADRVVLASAEKRELGEFADAVEMESFGVLIEGRRFAEKIVAVRAVSDTVDEDLPLDFNRVADDSGEISITRVLGQIALSPTSVPALVRFGQRSKSAAEGLANFLERYILSIVAAHATEVEGARTA